MRIKGVILLTLILFFAITGLIFHLLAIFTQRWIVVLPRQPTGPNDQAHYYGLWTRCQYSNTSFVIPDISSQPNIENFVCRPNLYLRYDIYNEKITKMCYESRHQCSSIVGIHPDCSCQYLPSTQGQQWCCILAGIFLIIAIFLFYLKLIATPQNASAAFVLTFVPMGLIGVAVLLMVITMILIGAYLRRNEYEDYDIKLPRDLIDIPMVKAPETVNFYRLNAFFKVHKGKKIRLDLFSDARLHSHVLSTFKSIHQRRFRTRIDWSAGAEIIAIVFTFIAHMLSIILALGRRIGV